MNTSTKVTIGAFAVILIAAAVFLVYGLLTHTEAGLKTPDARWPQDKIPLVVGGGSYTAEGVKTFTSDDRKVIDEMIGTVNGRLGFKAMRWARKGESEVVRIVVGVPQDENWEGPGGTYTLKGNPDTREWEACEIWTSNTGSPTALWLVTYHMGGHCLGLDHDDYRASIMYPTPRERAEGGFSPWISDSDRDLLRKLYGDE